MQKKQSIDIPISLTFDRAVNGYKALLLTANTTSSYDFVDSAKIIASTTVTSVDGKTLKVTPATSSGYYMNNSTVVCAYYTSVGDWVGSQPYTFSMTETNYLSAPCWKN